MERREFLKLSGTSGLVLLFSVHLGAAFQEPEQVPQHLAGYPDDFNAYLRIGADGRVGCCVGKVELGQGSETALAMLVAEELDVPLDQVDMLMGDTDLCPWDIGTFGSLNMWQFGPVLRGAAAEARAVLLQLAGEQLGVPAERLEVEAGVVFPRGDRAHRVSYGQLVQGRRIERHLKDVRPKPVTAYTLVGHPAPRKDARAKVTGAARYAADQALPGTLHACILRPPARGAALLSADTAEAEGLPGVRVVREGGFVAVLHEAPDLARAALERVKATFGPPPMRLDPAGLYRHLLDAAPPAQVLDQAGDLAAGEAAAAIRVEEEFHNAYVAHAPLEPHAAVARFAGGRVTVWASVQAPFMVRTQVAQALGLPPKAVRIITPFVGGGFGGKSAGPQAVEAARLARSVGRPVQVSWSRREEFALDAFRPAAVVRARAGLDRAGRITFWDYLVVAAGEREAGTRYAIPNRRVRSSGDWGGDERSLHPFPVGPWRGPSANTNVFARESLMDILAARAKADPLAFRLRHLEDPRLRRVLAAARDRFGWVPGPAPSGRGAGVACAYYRGTAVAAMAEVAVDRGSGRIQVRRVVLAQDMGLVVNPDGARQQMEGSILMGLGPALGEEVRFRDGTVLDENFDTYQLPRFSWLPRIDTVLVANPGLPAQSGGEPPIVCMGAVLANAVFDAAGIRLRELPMTPERVLAALRA